MFYLDFSGSNAQARSAVNAMAPDLPVPSPPAGQPDNFDVQVAALVKYIVLNMITFGDAATGPTYTSDVNVQVRGKWDPNVIQLTMQISPKDVLRGVRSMT